MYKPVNEIIAESKIKEAELRKAARDSIGNCCDALRGFIDTAAEWKDAADRAFDLDIPKSREDPFIARALSLSILTNRTLEISNEIVRVVQAGSRRSALASWRALAEAKNNALLIDLDVSGTAGFLWQHYGVIENARIHKGDEAARRNAEISEKCLAEAGCKYKHQQREHWAKGVDGKPLTNAVARSRYVANNRKLPPQVDKRTIQMLAQKEQEMIREANFVVHPTFSRHTVDVSLPWIMLSAIIEPMAVMLAYKAAASDAAGWPYSETVGEQFQIYPAETQEVAMLSLMVMETYQYCLDLFRSQFQLDGSAA